MLIIFDLDGVLVSAKKIHYEALNKALGELDIYYIIPWETHLRDFDGLKTTEKMKLLSERKGLPIGDYDRVWRRKQEITQTLIDDLKRDERLIDMCIKLRKDGHTLACCSNSIRRSVIVMLSKIGLIEHMDLILSNDDVKNSKPHPELYWKAMSMLNRLPADTLIVEDSPPGLLAAHTSGASVLRVINPEDLTYNKIVNKINNSESQQIPQWQGDKMNIVIPMSGRGSRFKVGYTFPKPLIPINKFDSKPMIQVVVENLNINAQYIFIVQKEHYETYNLEALLKLISPNCIIVQTDGVTEGAACSVLLARQYIDNALPLLISDSDHFIEWNSNEFMYFMQENTLDGGIATFTGTHPKYSYCRLDDNGYVSEVAEKKPISTNANVGRYYWKMGSDFVKYADQMITKQLKINDEYYIAPIYNEAIIDDKKIKIYPVKHMWSLGDPEALEYFERNYEKKASA